MKNSNKVLLIACLTILAMFTFAFMDLRRRVVNGIYEPYVDENPLFMVMHAVDRPVYISVNGVENVTVIPADTFAIGYIKSLDTARDNHLKPVMKRIGDSLFITAGSMMPQRKGEASFEKLGQLMIYGSGTSMIAANGGTIRLEGRKDTGDLPVNVMLNDTRLVVGETDEPPGDLVHQDYFSQVTIACINSNIELGKNAHIQNLRLQIDSPSRAVINQGDIGKLFIRSHPAAELILSGEQIHRIIP